MDNVLNIRNVEPSVVRRFRVVVAELGLSQAETLEWLMHKADVWTLPAAAAGSTHPLAQR